MKTELQNIKDLLDNAKQARNLSIIETIMLDEATRGLEDDVFSRKEVRSILKKQINRSVNAISRMKSTDSQVCRKLKRIKPVNF